MSEITLNNSCLKCALYLGAKSCIAYPKEGKIPAAIWDGKNDHKKPYRGDKNITFEPIKK